MGLQHDVVCASVKTRAQAEYPRTEEVLFRYGYYAAVFPRRMESQPLHHLSTFGINLQVQPMAD